MATADLALPNFPKIKPSPNFISREAVLGSCLIGYMQRQRGWSSRLPLVLLLAAVDESQDPWFIYHVKSFVPEEAANRGSRNVHIFFLVNVRDSPDLVFCKLIFEGELSLLLPVSEADVIFDGRPQTHPFRCRYLVTNGAPCREEIDWASGLRL